MSKVDSFFEEIALYRKEKKTYIDAIDLVMKNIGTSEFKESLDNLMAMANKYSEHGLND